MAAAVGAGGEGLEWFGRADLDWWYPGLRGRYQLCLCEEIIAETAATLLTKQSVRSYAEYADEDVRAYLGWLLRGARLVTDLPEIRVVPDDPDDDMVVATALVAEAEYLVTGDRHLLGSARTRAFPC